jgi:hypothetical protein
MPEDHAPRHEILMIHDRSTAEAAPHGHTVACPRKGWVSIVECLGCSELADVRFDPSTNASFIECAPKSADTKG